MNKYLTLGLLIALEAACTHHSPLEEALHLSGNNRVHLEQVLHHYSQYPEDSLKYRAACFLIENMPGHGWYEGAELDNYHRWVDSVYGKPNEILKATLHEICFQWTDMVERLIFREDIEHLDSNFLITHIDSTFSAAAKRPWLKALTFDQFCEHILPYRVGHERPRLLHRLQDSIFQTAVKPLLGYDNVPRDASLVFHLQPSYRSFLQNDQVFYRGHSVYQELIGCVSITHCHLWMSKLLLCPGAMDMTPAYPFRNDRHCWAVMLDNMQIGGIKKLMPELGGYGKVYRRTFSKHPLPVANGNEYIPPFFRKVFYRDVTADYTTTSDITITPQTSVSASYAYLCVFNDLKWEAVAWAPREKGNFWFKDVGRGVVYLPVVYSDSRKVAISYPFILHPTGKTEFLCPDTNRLQTLRLERKYPQQHTIGSYNQRFTKAFVEASNDSRFRQADSLGGFTNISNHQWAEVTIPSSKPYRYWRIRSSESFIMGECMLYNTDGKRVIPPKLPLLGYREAFDDDPISYVFSSTSHTFTMDLGEPMPLNKIGCMLRNDGNSVWRGHWYELFYYDGTGWCSLGIQEAQEKWLEFNNVPTNALLWLRDLTTGRQERIFTTTNNDIYFW